MSFAVLHAAVPARSWLGVKRQLVATYTNDVGRLVGAVDINAPRALIAYADKVTALPKRRTADRMLAGGGARP